MVPEGLDLDGQRLTLPSYEEWVTNVFDGAGTGFVHDLVGRLFDDAGEVSSGQLLALERLGLAYITRLFEQPAEWADGRSDRVIGAGLAAVISGTRCEDIGGLEHAGMPRAEVSRCLEAVPGLFATLLEPRLRCSAREDPTLAQTVFMWWDLWSARPGNCDWFDALCLDQMARILRMPSDHCIRSALHGLGHWYWAHPELVRALVDEFLAGSPKLSRPLRRYARAARRGLVL